MMSDPVQFVDRGLMMKTHLLIAFLPSASFVDAYKDAYMVDGSGIVSFTSVIFQW